MYSGIVKGNYEVVEVRKKPYSLHYAVKFSNKLLDNLEIGASVSVEGVCQTVVKIEGNHVYFDVIQETLNRTTLKDLKVGDRVNLERSLRFGDEVGGHLLAGHVMGMGKIISIEDNIYTIQCPSSFIPYVFKKGFIAVDGASLTVCEVNKNGCFTVNLIPETLRLTTLSKKNIGDYVNIEIDSQTQTIVDTISSIPFTIVCKCSRE